MPTSKTKAKKNPKLSEKKKLQLETEKELAKITFQEPPPSVYVFGRPTKYEPRFCGMLVDHMRKGGSFESFGAVVMAATSTLYEWEQKHKDFAEAKKLGRAHLQKTLEGLGLSMITGKIKGGSAAVWVFYMKNMTGWRDDPAVPLDAPEELEFING